MEARLHWDAGRIDPRRLATLCTSHALQGDPLGPGHTNTMTDLATLAAKDQIAAS